MGVLGFSARPARLRLAIIGPYRLIVDLGRGGGATRLRTEMEDALLRGTRRRGPRSGRASRGESLGAGGFRRGRTHILGKTDRGREQGTNEDERRRV